VLRRAIGGDDGQLLSFGALGHDHRGWPWSERLDECPLLPSCFPYTLNRGLAAGAAAHGRTARYSYHVCCSRQRGGLAKCSAERVPADPLEQGVLNSLAQTFAQPEVITRAVETARLELDLKRPD
jgi:hypothetical protein